MGNEDIKFRRVRVDPPGPDALHEVVTIHNHGAQTVDLTGWRLSDEGSHAEGEEFVFTFPTFHLGPDSRVNVHTGAGTNDTGNLFWGRVDAVWNNIADRAFLADTDGIIVDEIGWPPMQDGLVLGKFAASTIENAITSAGTIGGAQPTGPLQWSTRGPAGGEIFWLPIGDAGTMFHRGFPDSIPAAARKPETDVISVTGPIFQKFNAVGTVDRPTVALLGRPLKRQQEVPTREPARTALRQDFDGGTIVWSASTGAHVVLDEIRRVWEAFGGSDGRMGLPIADQVHDPEGAITYQEFEIGSVWVTPTSAHAIGGVAIDFMGFRCNESQFGPGADEVYFIVSAGPVQQPGDGLANDADGIWTTVLPAPPLMVYEDIDDGTVQTDPNLVFLGRAVPLSLRVTMVEHDHGDPNAVRDQIKGAVTGVGVVLSAIVPAASVVALNPVVIESITGIINGIADTDDDIFPSGGFGFGTRKQLMDVAAGEPQHEFDIPFDRKVHQTDGDASYDAYFQVRFVDVP